MAGQKPEAEKRGSSAMRAPLSNAWAKRSEEHTSELQSLTNLVCRLLLEKKKKHRLRLEEPESLIEHLNIRLPRLEPVAVSTTNTLKNLIHVVRRISRHRVRHPSRYTCPR